MGSLDMQWKPLSTSHERGEDDAPPRPQQTGNLHTEHTPGCYYGHWTVGAAQGFILDMQGGVATPYLPETRDRSNSLQQLLEVAGLMGKKKKKEKPSGISTFLKKFCSKLCSK